MSATLKYIGKELQFDHGLDVFSHKHKKQSTGRLKGPIGDALDAHLKIKKMKRKS